MSEFFCVRGERKCVRRERKCVSTRNLLLGAKLKYNFYTLYPWRKNKNFDLFLNIVKINTNFKLIAKKKWKNMYKYQKSPFLKVHFWYFWNQCARSITNVLGARENVLSARKKVKSVNKNVLGQYKIANFSKFLLKKTKKKFIS